MGCFLCSSRWLFPVVSLEGLQRHLWERRPEEEPSVQQPSPGQRWEALSGVRFRNAKLSTQALSRYASSFRRQTRSFPSPRCGGSRRSALSSKVSDGVMSHLRAVDGSWSDWSPWEECTRSCGRGNRTRTRTCSNPSAQHGGRPCEGAAVEMIMCNVRPCPGETPPTNATFLSFTPIKGL